MVKVYCSDPRKLSKTKCSRKEAQVQTLVGTVVLTAIKHTQVITALYDLLRSNLTLIWEIQVLILPLHFHLEICYLYRQGTLYVKKDMEPLELKD